MALFSRASKDRYTISREKKEAGYSISAGRAHVCCCFGGGKVVVVVFSCTPLSEVNLLCDVKSLQLAVVVRWQPLPSNAKAFHM